VDGLACPLHHPIAYSSQTRGRDIMSGAALSRHAAVSSGTIPGSTKPWTWIFAGMLIV
jgi:hypothetical protein